MQKFIKIVFDNSFSLEWSVNESSVAVKWMESLQKMLDEKGFPDRLHFIHFTKDDIFHHYTELKNNYEKILENIKNIPELKKFEEIDQTNLNEMHDWFAKNENTFDLLNSMHLNLHSLEGSLLGKTDSPYLQIAWSTAFPISFEDVDYENFTTNRSFGDIELTYHHIGKSLHAIFISKDALSDTVFVPHTDFSANFVIGFENIIKESKNDEFWKWYDENYEWIKSRTNYTKRDPKVALGSYKVASLINDITKDEVLKKLNLNSKITDIRCYAK